MKKMICLMLAFILCLSLASPAMAATNKQVTAANRLYELGLFEGVGADVTGRRVFDLDRAPNRAEAVTLLVRLLGKESAALSGSWETPFTDVPDWAKPYVGYAFENSLTDGTSATTFSSADTVSATQYLTFVLRALGYSSETDFKWDSAWEKTNELGITSGEYDSAKSFTRGDAVLVSSWALDTRMKDGGNTLLEAIKAILPSDATSIISAAERKANVAANYEVKTTTAFKITVKMLGQSQAATASMVQESTVFLSPLKMKTNVTAYEDGIITQRAETYVVQENGLYVLYSNASGFWQSQTLTESEFGALMTEESSGLMAEGFTKAGDELLNGIQTTKYIGKISSRSALEGAGLADMIKEISGIDVSEQELKAIYAGFDDISVSVWISSDGYPVRYQIDMTNILNRLLQELLKSYSDEALPFEISFSEYISTVDYLNFNRAADFTVPAEAKK